MAKRNDKMETLVFKGVITATSNKQSGKFKTANPRKSLYVVVDEISKDLLETFGLQEYTTEEGDKFFILKASENITNYDDKNEKVGVVKGDIESPNFNSGGADVEIALLKAVSEQGTDYFRVYAIKGELASVEQENPFA